ncbi:MAG: hypothetical protein FJZ01_00775 [Candidatus Sericytochromatia bacterium]|nr:hypothetical protein [Candidatus Tanganyikabacteria bacterium]
MIGVPPAKVAGRLATLRACDLLERVARWGAVLEQLASAAGQGGGQVVARLRARLASITDRLAGSWTDVPRLLEGDSQGAEGIAGSCAGAAEDLRRLEQALRKLPGLPVRAEVYQFLSEQAGDGAIPPVILVPEDQDLDDDGFLALPIAQVAAPLAWPRLVFGLVAARSPGVAEPAARDLAAARLVGPAYLFSLLERGVHGQVPGLADRAAGVATDLATRGALYPELGNLLATCGVPGDWAAAEPGAAEAIVAARLADDVLASARPTEDFARIRAARERVLQDPAAGAEAVYGALAGLREEPLSGAQILAGAWLFRERSRVGWLREAAAGADPWEAYGRRVLQLDSLVLKSLETASVHRHLGVRE